MAEKTIFPREEKAEALFDKILSDPWACEKLQETFCKYLFCSEEESTPLSASDFTQALFNAYLNRDLSAFLMAICQHSMFDLLRNSYLIPFRFNADGKQNPIIMTDDNGGLLPEYQKAVHPKEYEHFREVYDTLPNKRNLYLAKAYCYTHSYDPETATTQQVILQEHTGILLIRELPDTVKQQETEAQAYCAVWDLMADLEKELPMAFVFYGQDSLIEHDKRYDELGIFLPNSHFLKHLEKHVQKAEEIIYATK